MHLVKTKGCSVHFSEYSSYVRFSNRRISFAFGIFVTKFARSILPQAKGRCRTSEKTLLQSTLASSSLGIPMTVDLHEPRQFIDGLLFD